MINSGNLVRICLVTVVYGFHFLYSPLFADDRPQWGSKHVRNMISSETDLPSYFNLETGENILWKADVGFRTYATPVVAGGKVFIGTNNERPRDPRRDDDLGVLMCFDEDNGGFLWQLPVPKRESDPFLDWPRTGASSPPTVESNRVYFVDNRGNVLCLDINGMKDGNDGAFQDEAAYYTPAGDEPVGIIEADADIIWMFNPADEAGVHQHDAAHCSILLDGRFLYVNTSNGVDNRHRSVPAPGAPSLIVLDKASGRMVARDGEDIGPRIIHGTWSSPAMAEVNERKLVFFGGGDAVCYAFEALTESALDGGLKTLERVWRFDCDPNAPKEDIHRYQDNRREGPSLISGMPVFHDSRVYVAAGGDIWHGKPWSWLKCIDATKNGDITESGEVWSFRMESFCVTTPAISGDLIYIADCSPAIHCLDARTGERYWSHESRGDFWSSPLAADGKVYIATTRGNFFVFNDARDKELVFETKFDNGINGTVVAADKTLFVATMQRLYAIKEEAVAEPND